MEGNIFEEMLGIESLFLNREVLHHGFTPERLPHRDQEIQALVCNLVDALHGHIPSNMVLYGAPGSGKTAVTRFVCQQLGTKGDELGRKVTTIEINCQSADTKYRVLENLGNGLKGISEAPIPFTGWPADKVLTCVRERMDAIGGVHVIVLDEVDHLVRRSGDDILYTLANLNTDLRNARCCLIGISNDLSFTDELDPRVTSRLGQEDLVFTPYNASQLEVILTERATAGIKADVLGGGVVSLCAALAAKEHGDARRALDLLRLAVHKAEQEAVEQVDVSHVRKAQSQLEFDQITPVIASLPLHSKFVLFSILTNESNGLRNLPTGLVYQVYEMACSNASENCLTGRSISTLISALDTLGLITAQTISKGRYGRSKQINSCIPKTVDPIDVMIGAEPTMIDVAAATYRLQGRLRT